MHVLIMFLAYRKRNNHYCYAIRHENLMITPLIDYNIKLFYYGIPLSYVDHVNLRNYV